MFWGGPKITLRILSSTSSYIYIPSSLGPLKNVSLFLFWLKILGQSIFREAHESCGFSPNITYTNSVCTLVVKKIDWISSLIQTPGFFSILFFILRVRTHTHIGLQVLKALSFWFFLSSREMSQNHHNREF